MQDICYEVKSIRMRIEDGILFTVCLELYKTYFFSACTWNRQQRAWKFSTRDSPHKICQSLDIGCQVSQVLEGL